MFFIKINPGEYYWASIKYDYDIPFNIKDYKFIQLRFYSNIPGNLTQIFLMDINGNQLRWDVKNDSFYKENIVLLSLNTPDYKDEKFMLNKISELILRWNESGSLYIGNITLIKGEEYG
jgi:hypothetical protein